MKEEFNQFNFKKKTEGKLQGVRKELNNENIDKNTYQRDMQKEQTLSSKKGLDQDQFH